MNTNEVENELKHWGILGMKWGIRNYQNEDGSLTPLGRIRYGVGPGKNITGNVMGANDAQSLSDEELRRMAKRYQAQGDYYKARNYSIYQENQFKLNTAPPKKEHNPSRIGKFIDNVVVQPLENVMSKNANFINGMIGYELLKNSNPQAAEMYFNTITNSNFRIKSNDEKELEKLKQELEILQKQHQLDEEKDKYSDDAKAYKELEKLLKKMDLENKIKDAEKKRDDPYSDLRDPTFGRKGDTPENRQKYYDARKKFEDEMNKTINEVMNDNTRSNDEIIEAINRWKFVYGKDKPLN